MVATSICKFLATQAYPICRTRIKPSEIWIKPLNHAKTQVTLGSGAKVRPAPEQAARKAAKKFNDKVGVCFCRIYTYENSEFIGVDKHFGGGGGGAVLKS